MDLQDPTTQFYAVALTSIPLVALLLFKPSGLVKWVQKKNYQYEVTMSLYMLTPTEIFIFNSVLFLTLAMFALASFIYLPDHVLTMSRRTYYYFAGEALTQSAAEFSGAAKAAITTAEVSASELYTAALSTAARVAEEVSAGVSGGAR